jgi:site-specific DNA-methyltransferase (adenine-specific)
MKTETLFSKNSDEWQTPLELFQDLDREFHFDLDACATHDNHMVDAYFTKDEDGLEQNWGGATQCGVIPHTAR